MAAGDLTTLASLEPILGLTPGNTDEALLAQLITAASGFIASWCGCGFVSQSYSETRDGSGGRRMPFGYTPVSAVTGLAIDGIAVAPGDANATPGYYFTPTMLYLNGFVFARGLGNVALSYTAGYATVPAEVAEACNELVAFRYRELERIGMSSKGLAGETTAFVVRDMPPSVATLLETYRRVVPR